MHDVKSKPLPEFSEATKRRFWSKVKIGTDAECWPWTASINKYGYGQFGTDGKFRASRAHRVAYFLHHGVDPLSQIILHSCNFRACCNPAHMSLGTRKDNSDDRDKQGRTAKGEQIGNSVLTDELVRQIRREREAGEKPTVLAKRYGISYIHVWYVVTRRIWKHID